MFHLLIVEFNAPYMMALR